MGNGVLTVEEKIIKLVIFFKRHKLSLNANRTEFTFFPKNILNPLKNWEMTVGRRKISSSKTIKYLNI